MLSEKCSHDFANQQFSISSQPAAAREVHFIQPHNSAVIRGVAKKRARSLAFDFDPPNRRNHRAFQSAARFSA
jgi:hypothetical protein